MIASGEYFKEISKVRPNSYDFGTLEVLKESDRRM